MMPVFRRRSIVWVGIVVPARNEAALVCDAIDAIDLARSRLGPAVATSLVVVADACRDSTATLARRRLRGPNDAVVETSLGCVGAARRIGVETLRRRATVSTDRLWLASTDADTLVDPDWLATQVAMADDGHLAIAGVVRLGGDVGPELRRQFERHYDIEGNGSHRHVHGANLGLRCDLYDLVGGWRAHATGEEHDLWRRIQATGLQPTATTRLQATTSARTHGRAPRGFAADIARLGNGVA